MMASAQQVARYITEQTGLRVLSVAPARPLPKVVIQEVDVWAVWTEQGTFYVVDGEESMVIRRGPRCSSPYAAYLSYKERRQESPVVVPAALPLGLTA